MPLIKSLCFSYFFFFCGYLQPKMYISARHIAVKSIRQTMELDRSQAKTEKKKEKVCCPTHAISELTSRVETRPYERHNGILRAPFSPRRPLFSAHSSAAYKPDMELGTGKNDQCHHRLKRMQGLCPNMSCQYHNNQWKWHYVSHGASPGDRNSKWSWSWLMFARTASEGRRW